MASRDDTSPIFIGIDGGGTSTKAVAAAENGASLGEAQTGPANPNNVGFPAAAREIVAAIHRCVGSDLASKRLFICCGIAGLADSETSAALRKALLAQQPDLANAELRLTHDLEIAHFAAFRDSPGILVIAGTGSACFARTPAGETIRLSGRAVGFNDPGSGFAIAQQAIELRLIHTPETAKRDEVAALAPQVLERAAQANPIAQGILSTEAQRLAKLAEPLFANFTETTPIAFAGSLLSTDNPFQQRFLTLLQERVPTLARSTLHMPPHHAALQMARSLADR